MKAKERMGIARQMPVEMTPAERVKNFDEIAAARQLPRKMKMTTKTMMAASISV